MKLFSGLALMLFFLSANLNAQSCSKAKSKVKNWKSNTLNQQQLAKMNLYDVHYYQLNLNLEHSSSHVSGTVEMHGKALASCDSVLFELFNTYTISNLSLNGTPAIFKRKASAISVPVNLDAGQSFIISVTYDGDAPTAASNPLGGGGLTNDFSPSWGNQVTWSLSEPFSAYEWFPCKQSLRDKIDSVDLNLTVPSVCKAGANGLLKLVTDLGNGKSTYHWEHRYPIDYYLISVSVAEYVDYSFYAHPTVDDSILIQNFVYNNPGTLPNFKDDIDETADFIRIFSEKYGLYPFHNEKYGHCMAPLSGGMEHQTMTTQGYFERSLTAHELGHQWWGDQVTCASWADIWLNEGFASYSEYIMLENLYPGDQIADMQDKHNNVMSQLDGSIWVLDSLDDGRIFSGRLTYDKGAALVHTLRFLFDNDSVFFAALRDYQQTYRFKTATVPDLKAILEQHSGLDLTKTFEEWYYGEGFPTYSLRWNTFGDSVHLQLNQTVSAVNATPFFSNPVEIRIIKSVGGDTIIRVQPGAPSSSFLLADFGSIISVNAIDPNNWIVNQTDGIVRDLNLNVAGIQDLIPEYQLQLFPNPASDHVQISTPYASNWTIRVIDASGRLVQVFELNQQINLDVRNLKAGNYIIELQDKSQNNRYRKMLQVVRQ